jgi:peptide/nickel transport system ATP-binding protein
MSDALLQVTDLTKWFPVRKGFVIERTVDYVKAVDDVSFEINEGETLGLVGESGSGKSTTGYCVLQLLKPTSGSVRFMGKELTTMSRNDLREMRNEMQIVFQDPYSSLNPRMTVGNIVGEPMAVHGQGSKKDRERRVRDLLETVGFNPDFTNRYPHEFSGGQRQRIGIARALALNPRLIVCDEPVSALDVSIQAQVVNLLEDIQDELNLSYVFIAHDLSVVRHISDRVVVMYLGRVMEEADRDTLYEHPLHPYTHALMSAVPVPDPRHSAGRERIILSGDLPSPQHPPSGCVFRTRCPKAQQKCADEFPPPVELAPGHRVACHFPEERTVI